VEDKILGIRCQQAPSGGKGILGLTCLGRLTENILLGAFCLGAKRIELLRGECTSCEYHKGYQVFRKTLNITYPLLQLVGIHPSQLIEVEGFSGDSKIEFLPEPSLDRRAFFRFFRGRTLKKVKDLLFPSRTRPVPSRWGHPVNPRRELLLAILSKFPGYYPVRLTANRDLPFAQLEVSGECLGCKVCETLCPPGAIRRSVEQEEIVLSHYPPLCTNCGICWDSCLVKAIKTRRELAVDHIFRTGWQEMARIKRRTCKVCGEQLINLEGDQCPTCVPHRHLLIRRP